jgi:hypothetical protein
MPFRTAGFRLPSQLWNTGLAAILLSLLALQGCATTGAGQSSTDGSDQDWYMHVVDDEESIEKRIATYFRERYDVEAEYLFADENDLYLQYVLSSNDGNYPDLLVYVDSQPSATNLVDGEEKTTERRVTVSAYYVLPDEFKTTKVRAVLLEKINHWHIGRWVPQRIYLDKDGDIVLESTFNIPGDDYPVHVEIVGDQILRMNSAWQEFYLDLSDLIDPKAPVNNRQIALNL